MRLLVAVRGSRHVAYWTTRPNLLDVGGAGRSIRALFLVGAVGIAVVVAGVGLSGRPSFSLPRQHGPDPHWTAEWLITLAAVLGGVVILYRSRRLTVAYQRLTYRLVGTVVILGPAILLQATHITKRLAPPRSVIAPPAAPPPSVHRGRSGSRGGGFSIGLSTLGTVVMVLLVLVAVALLGVAMYHARLRLPARPVTGASAGDVPPDAASILGSAAGAIALGSSPRDQVIAAYEAMESALRRDGIARERQQTPLEWLTDLSHVRPGVVEPADALTATFERARFSTGPVTPADADDAARLLGELSSRLGVPA